MALSVDFAFEGFRIVRQRPVLILFWGPILLIGYGLGLGTFIGMAGAGLETFVNLAKQGNSANPASVATAMGQVLPGYFAMVFILIIVNAFISSAIFRQALGGANTRFGGLRVGGDEIRLIAAGAIFFLLSLVFNLVLAIVLGPLDVVIGMAAPPLASAVHFVLEMGATLWVMSRMSLYAVQSFDQKRINMFGTWSLTKGHAGTLVIGYIIAIVLSAVVYVLCATIFVGITAVLTVGQSMPKTDDPTALARAWQTYWPLMAAAAAMMWVILPLVVAILFGAPAAAYRQLTAGRGA